MVNIDALLTEWAYRCQKGYPDLDSPSDLRILKNILNEQGIEMPNLQKSEGILYESILVEGVIDENLLKNFITSLKKVAKSGRKVGATLHSPQDALEFLKIWAEYRINRPDSLALGNEDRVKQNVTNAIKATHKDFEFPQALSNIEDDKNKLQDFIDDKLPDLSIENLGLNLSESLLEQEEKKKKVTATDIAKLVQDMEKDGVLKDKHLTFLNQYLTSRPFKDTVDSFLKTKNIDDNTLSKDEIAAQDQIFKILQDEGQVEEFTNYMKDPINLSDLPKTGNLFDEVKKASGLKDSTIQRILHLKGTEGGRGVGKAELFLSMFFKDVKMRVVGKGDLTWNNKYLEVKGSDARLGKRAVSWLGYKNSILGKLANEYDKSDKALPSLISNLADEVDPPTDLPKLRDGIKEFAKEAYSKSDLTDKLVDGLSDEDLKNENKIRKVLTTLYYDSYAKSEDVDDFIFVNTKMRKKDGASTFGRYNSRYRVFGADEIEDLINTNQMTLSGNMAVDDLYPTLRTI